jgi:SAM-dependent methyltransferase
MDTLAELHTPLIPILRHTLALAPLPRAGLALDLACGPGLKAPLLAEACGPGVRLLGIDVDLAAIRAVTTDHRPPTTDHRPPTTDHRRWEIEDRRSRIVGCGRSIFDPRSSILKRFVGRRLSVVSRQSSVVGVVGDAQALPLRDGCCAAAFCIAALSLFPDRRAALRELRRTLAPGGVALLVVGAQAWAQIVRWPADLAARLAAAYAQALAAGIAPPPATPDLGGDLADLLLGAGFAAPLIRAFLLDRPTTPRTANRAATDYGLRATDSPLAAELPLLPWPALRPLLAGRLFPTELARCDELAAGPQIELCTLALVAQARAGELRRAPAWHSHLFHKFALS